jgi:hypothetical protein
MRRFSVSLSGTAVPSGPRIRDAVEHHRRLPVLAGGIADREVEGLLLTVEGRGEEQGKNAGQGSLGSHAHLLA